MSPQSRLLNRGWQREVCGLPRVPDLACTLLMHTLRVSSHTRRYTDFIQSEPYVSSYYIRNTWDAWLLWLCSSKALNFPAQTLKSICVKTKVSSPSLQNSPVFPASYFSYADIRITFFYAFMSSNFYMVLLRGLPLCWLYEGEFNITV